MRATRWAVACAVLVGLAFARVGIPARADPTVGPKTLAEASSEIWTFAQDGRYVAWVTLGGRCYYTLHIRALGTGRTVSIDRIACGTLHGGDVYRDFAVAGGRALWTVLNHFSNQQYGVLTRTASVGDMRIRTLPCCDLEHDEDEGPPAFPVAGSGNLLVYYSHKDVADGPDQERAVRRVIGGRAVKVFDVEEPTDLAVDDARIAVVGGRSTAGEIRSAKGDLVASLEPKGIPRAVALAGSLAAILTPRNIELFDARSGSARAVVRVPAGTAANLGANDHWIVFTVGRTIRAVDALTRRTHVLARASGSPIGLSVSGRRVAWAENVGGRGRVRAVTLPR